MWGSQNRPEKKPGPRTVFLGESYFLEKTDQRVPMRVSRAPLTSVTTVSATMPCITRNPPTKVRVCLTRPITCSFVMVVFSSIYPPSLLVRTRARRPDLSVLVHTLYQVKSLRSPRSSRLDWARPDRACSTCCHKGVLLTSGSRRYGSQRALNFWRSDRCRSSQYWGCR